MRILGLVLAAAAGLLWGAPAWAQAPNAKVVAACGAAALPLGSSLIQMDQTGDLCTNATGGGGGPLTGTNLSATIAVTNTFQPIQVATPTRKGCTVQNNSATTDNEWVYLGPIGSATKASAIMLTPGGSFSCTSPNGVRTEQISITGTSGDSFYADAE